MYARVFHVVLYISHSSTEQRAQAEPNHAGRIFGAYRKLIGGPDAERLVKGRERIYLDRFWNEFAGDRTKIDEATRVHYAKLYARPGAMRAAFAQFNTIRQDAEDNKVAMATKLLMPVLAIGGEKSFGANEAVVMRNAATDVTELVVPSAGHWLMEEAPASSQSVVQEARSGTAWI